MQHPPPKKWRAQAGAAALSLAVIMFHAPAIAQSTSKPPAAQTNPLTQSRAQTRDALFDALKNADNEASARAIENEIWKFWTTAPDAKSKDLMQKAMMARRSRDFAGAMTFLDQLVAHAPKYSEGWNQRATVLFLQQKYDASLADIEKTLQLEPNHFGALSGQMQIFFRTGRIALARSTLMRALKVNPWMRERMLLNAHPKKLPGEKI